MKTSRIPILLTLAAGLSCSPAARQPEPPGPAPAYRIAAVYFDTLEEGGEERAEAVALVNVGAAGTSLTGFTITDGEGAYRIPEAEGAWDSRLGIDGRPLLRPPAFRDMAPTGGWTWLSRDGSRFRAETSKSAAYVWGESAPDLRLDNDADELQLLDPEGNVVDAVAWGGEARTVEGWSGPPVQRYRFANWVPVEGMMIARKRSPDGLPRDPTDSAADWISDPGDAVSGRSMAYGSWFIEATGWLGLPPTEADAAVGIYPAPEQLGRAVMAMIDRARSEILIEIYLITHPLVADRLVAALDRGVTVDVLFEGEVFRSDGGTHDSVRYAAQLIAEHASGRGRVRFLRDSADPETGAPLADPYNNTHAKYLVVDGKEALVSTENLTQGSLPISEDGTISAGNRGFGIWTDAAPVVDALRHLHAVDGAEGRPGVTDYDPERDSFGERPAVDPTCALADPVAEEAFRTMSAREFEVTVTPEDALRPSRGFLRVAGMAGRGDRLISWQQYDYASWGPGDEATSSPRVQAYVGAARRGASVRIIVNGAYGRDANEALQKQLREIAAAEGLDIDCRLGAPTACAEGRAAPVHAKVIALGKAGGDGYAMIGSVNGSENASRYNREVSLTVRSGDAFRYLEGVFDGDWAKCPDGTENAGAGTSGGGAG